MGQGVERHRPEKNLRKEDVSVHAVLSLHLNLRTEWCWDIVVKMDDRGLLRGGLERMRSLKADTEP